MEAQFHAVEKPKGNSLSKTFYKKSETKPNFYRKYLKNNLNIFHKLNYVSIFIQISCIKYILSPRFLLMPPSIKIDVQQITD